MSPPGPPATLELASDDADRSLSFEEILENLAASHLKEVSELRRQLYAALDKVEAAEAAATARRGLREAGNGNGHKSASSNAVAAPPDVVLPNTLKEDSEEKLEIPERASSTPSKRSKPSMPSVQRNMSTADGALRWETAQGYEGYLKRMLKHMGLDNHTLQLITQRESKAIQQSRPLWVFMNSAPVKTMCCLAILANALFIGFNTEYVLDCELQGITPHSWWTRVSETFSIWFAIELALRIAAERELFLRGPERAWNMMDSVLVFCSAIDFVSLSSAPNFTVTWLLRILRFTRILRILRVLRFSQNFRIMVFSILYSMTSLVWVLVVLIFFKYCFAIFFLHGATEFFKDPTDDVKLQEDLKKYFGSIPKALLTLFESITGGVDWALVCDALNEFSWLYSGFFIIYIFFMVFGVLNVVIGSVVKTTSLVYKRDRGMVIEDEMGRLNEYSKELKEFFMEADTDKSGTLSWEEFFEYMKDPKVKAYFQTLDLDISQANVLFSLLDVDNSNSIGVEEFVDGCFRLKGAARSIDVNMLMYQVEGLVHRLQAFQGNIQHEFRKIEHRLSHPTAGAASQQDGVFSVEVSTQQ